MAWVSEAIVEFLRGPMYVHPLMSFIDEKCLIFTPEEENKFEYTVIHGQFQELVDTLLTEFLQELGVSPEEFYKIADESKDQLTGFVVQTILTVDDFLMFKAMMVKRNIDLTNQVLNAVDELSRAVEADDQQSPVYPSLSSPLSSKPVLPEEDINEAVRQSKQDYEYEARVLALQKLMRSLQLQDEDVALAIATANSLKDGAKSQAELAELEQAIALSLALEAEQRRLAAAGGADATSASSAGGGSGSKAKQHQSDKGASSSSVQSGHGMLSEAFPEPKPMGMAPLPELKGLGKASAHVQAAPLDPLNIAPNTAADKMSAVAAAAARAASLLAGASTNTTATSSLPALKSSSYSRQEGEVVAQGKFIPEPLHVSDKKTAASEQPAAGSGKFVPAPLNLPDKAPKTASEVPAVQELMGNAARGIAGIGGTSNKARNRAAGFKSGGDFASVREAAAAAAATQKNIIAANKAAGGGGDDAANAWLQDAKKQLVAKKNAEREAEMAEYQEANKGSKKKAAPGGGGGAAGEDLEAKRAELRDKLAQKFKQDLMAKGM